MIAETPSIVISKASSRDEMAHRSVPIATRTIYISVDLGFSPPTDEDLHDAALVEARRGSRRHDLNDVLRGLKLDK